MLMIWLLVCNLKSVPCTRVRQSCRICCFSLSEDSGSLPCQQFALRLLNCGTESFETSSCGQGICSLSGPVSRDTARLSQRYPLLRAMGFLVSQHGQLGAIPPPPFLSVSPLESMRSGGAIPPPPREGYLSDTCAMPLEKRQKGCDTPLCDTISKGYCAIWGGISHWAAKFVHIPSAPKKLQDGNAFLENI